MLLSSSAPAFDPDYDSCDSYSDMVASVSPFVHLKAKTFSTKTSNKNGKHTLTKVVTKPKDKVLTNKISNTKFVTHFDDHDVETVKFGTAVLDFLIKELPKYPGLYIKTPSYHGRSTGYSTKKKCTKKAPTARLT